MPHGIEFTAVFVVCAVLVAGAATRALARRIRFPYTIAMMLLGLGLGLLFSNVHSDSTLVETLALLREGADISSHMILFVFLPALVFESAYAVDQHALYKERGAIAVLAGPALLVSTAFIGGGMYVLTWGAWDWNFAAALVFGALISATDPVAVVAILRDVNAPKRLGVLIEGESLFNDGTAIVVFMVLLGLLSSLDSGFSLGGTLQHFAVVVAGGAAVGLVLGVGTSWWMARTFNDPLVEISHTVVVAYLAMLIAEGLFHVSGVIGIVVAAMWLGGRGRTSTSPEVQHFLHQFWEMLAYIANTLIFFLVGLVISEQLGKAGVYDLFMVLGAYIIIILVRFFITYVSRPILAGVGSPISVQEATVISWGGLRGAVSLALAIYAGQELGPDSEISRQLLLTTAGVVLLTVFINGATSGWVMSRLGLTRRPASERLAQLAARAGALDRVKQRLGELAGQSGLRGLDWSKPMEDVNDRRDELARTIDGTQAELASAAPGERAVGYWNQAISVERTEYWAKFGRGTLSPSALRLLSEELDRHQDCLARGDLAPPRSRTESTIDRGNTIWQRFIARFTRLHLDRLALIHDVARAEAVGAADVLRNLGELGDADPELVSEIRATYEHNLKTSKQRIEEMRIDVPELVAAVESKLAVRIQLNAEREEYHRLGQEGLLSEGDSEKAVHEVEERMKRLSYAPIEVTLPSATELCRQTALFAELDDAALDAVAAIGKEHVLAPGEVVFRVGDKGTSAFLVVRGAAEVVAGSEHVLEVLGSGEVFGEMALLTDEPRSATVRAATTLTLLEIQSDLFDDLMNRQPEIRNHVWNAYTRRSFDNVVRALSRFAHLDHAQRLAWIGDPELRTAQPQESLDAGSAHVFLVTGALRVGDETISSPALIDRAELDRHQGQIIADDVTRFVELERL